MIRVVPDIRLAGYPVSVAGYPAGYLAGRITGYPARKLFQTKTKQFCIISWTGYIIYIQGRHNKSGQKEFLSHTFKNEVISFSFLYYMKKIII